MCDGKCGCKNSPDLVAKFAKFKEGATIPTKENEDAGYDLYACFDQDEIVIEEGEVKMIPTGIVTAFSEDWMAMIKERGSTGFRGMSLKAGVVDSSFRGEWMVLINNSSYKVIIISKDVNKTFKNLYANYKSKFYDTLKPDRKKAVNEKEFVENIVDRTTTIYPYTKAIAQFQFLPVPKAVIEEVSLEEVFAVESKRGTGMLGSSKK